MSNIWTECNYLEKLSPWSYMDENFGLLGVLLYGGIFNVSVLF